MLDSAHQKTTVTLHGKTFISTRPFGKSEELNGILKKYGAKLIEFPMIELSEKKCDSLSSSVLANLDNYSHIAFTSAYGFEFFYKKISRHNHFESLLSKIKIASIGYKTSVIINNYGLTIDFDGKAKTGNEFSDKFSQYLVGKNANLIWATGSLSPDNFVKKLSKVASVTRINLYENNPPSDVDVRILNMINGKEYDIIILASPSAFNNLSLLVDTQSLKVVCIGSSTANAAKKGGVKPLAVANEPTPQGIEDAILDYYQKNYTHK